MWEASELMKHIKIKHHYNHSEGERRCKCQIQRTDHHYQKLKKKKNHEDITERFKRTVIDCGKTLTTPALIST